MFFIFSLVILVELSVFNSLCILKVNYKKQASIFGEGEWIIIIFDPSAPPSVF